MQKVIDNRPSFSTFIHLIREVNIFLSGFPLYTQKGECKDPGMEFRSGGLLEGWDRCLLEGSSWCLLEGWYRHRCGIQL